MEAGRAKSDRVAMPKNPAAESSYERFGIVHGRVRPRSAWATAPRSGKERKGMQERERCGVREGFVARRVVQSGSRAMKNPLTKCTTSHCRLARTLI